MQQLPPSLAAPASNLIGTKHKPDVLGWAAEQSGFRHGCVRGFECWWPRWSAHGFLRGQAGSLTAGWARAVHSCTAAVSPFRNLSRERHVSLPSSMD